MHETTENPRRYIKKFFRRFAGDRVQIEIDCAQPITPDIFAEAIDCARDAFINRGQEDGLISSLVPDYHVSWNLYVS
jgi:hypothetical protein